MNKRFGLPVFSFGRAAQNATGMLVAVVLGVTATTTLAAARAMHYLRSGQVSIQMLLAPPPSDDSAQTKNELAQVLQYQQERTPEDEKRIEAEGRISIDGFFASSIGENFTADRLPLTFELLRKVGRDADAVANQGKKQWDRPRPPLLDSRVKPCVGLPHNGSYPSGHATSSTAWALVLAEVFPARKDAILARARQIGHDRIVGGVHLPSDVQAGEQLARLLIAKMKTDPQFISDLAKAQQEAASTMVK